MLLVIQRWPLGTLEGPVARGGILGRPWEVAGPAREARSPLGLKGTQIDASAPLKMAAQGHG